MKPEYKIGDTVYFICNDKIVKGKIQAINTRTMRERTIIKYEISGVYSPVTRDRFYATLEDVLNHLKENIIDATLMIERNTIYCKYNGHCVYCG
jgi:hypothetical protein